MGQVVPDWVTPVLAWMKEHPELAITVCFLLGFGESLAVVSLFVPSTALFLAIGGAQSAAGGAFWPLWIAGSVGAFLGDVISFALGRLFKDRTEQVWPFSAYPTLIPRSRTIFEKWGGYSIIGGKFVGGLRPFLPVAAGMMRMPWPTFRVASAFSCVLWAGVFLAPGYGVALLLK
jgi:membrane protein DedA with SNARE-associated domain